MSTVNRVRQAVLATAERHGFDEHLKRARAIGNPGLRRDLRDHHAMRLIVAVAVGRDSHTVEVGAHEGSVLRDLVDLAPEGRHLAFEPIPELRAKLDAEFGGVDTVEIHGAALSNEAGEATFHHVTTAPGYSGLRAREMTASHDVREITVPTLRLDDVVDEAFAPDFIKIDVEGAEMLVLLGARETIARHKPIIVFEHGEGGFEDYGYTPGDLHDLLVGDCGLRIFDLAGVGPYDRAGFEAVFTEPIWNFVAR